MREIVLSQEQIQKATKEVAEKINQELKGEDKIPVFIGVMKGAVHFMADLLKHITIPTFVDYIQVSSYFGTGRTGEINLVKDLTQDIKDRTVVIVEDIIDTGLSMEYLVAHLKEKYQPKRIIITALFDKVNARVNNLQCDYAGYILKENKFLVGYGLDYKELFRNVPYVFIPDENDLNEWDNLIEKSEG
jgi:hypoxanthine phosphoribosyltransferase